MGYERSEPLPEHEDRFENYYIRYTVQVSSGGTPCGLEAEVWETMRWDDGKPVFHFKAGMRSQEVETDPSKTEALFKLWTKWDGCSHLWLPYLHFDDLDEFDAFTRVVKYIYDDICERHDIGD